MAFNDLENEELLAVAGFFAVELPENLPKTKAAQHKVLVEVLTEGDDAVSWDDYENVYLPQKPKTAEELEAEAAAREEARESATRETLVKMQGRSSFTFGGIRITRDHPFALVSEDEAEYLVNKYEGFSYASPKEAAEYYN